MRAAPITAAASGPDPLLSLMQLTDSALPTGAFSQSLGFETYMQRGQIHDEGTFAEWLQMFADQQLTYTDALAIRLVYAAREVEEVVDLDELATVQALPQQVRDGGITMGPSPAEHRRGVLSGTVDAALRSGGRGRTHAGPSGRRLGSPRPRAGAR